MLSWQKKTKTLFAKEKPKKRYIYIYSVWYNNVMSLIYLHLEALYNYLRLITLHIICIRQT